MSHDKISAAARKRMAETGEPYATARRAVIREHQAADEQSAPSGARWFAISYSEAWVAGFRPSWTPCCSGLARAYRAWRLTPTRSGSGWVRSS